MVQRRSIAIKKINADFLDKIVEKGLFKNFSNAIDALIEEEAEREFLGKQLGNCKKDITFKAVAEKILGGKYGN